MAEFLFEIGLEEVPARMIAGAQAELQRRVLAMLEHARLIEVGAVNKSFSTPRRLAVWVGDVSARQQDVAEEMQGPAVKIAYKDGVPTAAAIAFAKKSGVGVESLRTVTTPKGEYLAATAVKAGWSAAEVIAEELPKELAGIYWAKNMYWRAGRPERFVRPVRWLLALLGGEVVPVSFGGCAAGRVTRGHRVLAGDNAIEIAGREGLAAEYEKALLAGFVIADVEARRHTIRKSLDRVCRTVPETRWREDHALVDKLTHLTEWPTVIAGGFEREYLALPEEVLVTVMRDHQGYFAVDDLHAKLAPYFLTVLNTEADAVGEAVIRHGNERVLRARFNDARFFWEFDQRVPLRERLPGLVNLTFQNKLGAQGRYSAKIRRLERLVNALVHIPETNLQSVQSVPVISGVDDLALKRAVQLSKCDLTTELVKEFTELQGQIGGLYAKFQGESDATSRAIYDQYRPTFSGDKVPSTLEGSILAIADRADTVSGMFAVGLEPTGSKDPFALRRAANGIVQILAESLVPLNLSLGFIAKRACLEYGKSIGVWSAEGEQSGLAEGGHGVTRESIPLDQDVLSERVRYFFTERLEFYLREAKGQAYDVVKAVLAAGANDVRDAVARAEAVTAVRGSEDFAAVSAAFKRMKNILAQAEERGILEQRVEIPVQTTMHPAQSLLTAAAANTAEKFWKLAAAHEYVAALELIATLRPQVDQFFKEVMVMDADPFVRESRLSLLGDLVRNFSKIADFSEIVVAG
jgi:glycyl-tRNA synthetase beta chain